MQRIKKPCQRPRKKDLPKNELWNESINANRYEDCLFDILKIRRSSMPHHVFFSFSADRDKKIGFRPKWYDKKRIRLKWRWTDMRWWCYYTTLIVHSICFVSMESLNSCHLDNDDRQSELDDHTNQQIDSNKCR